MSEPLIVRPLKTRIFEAGEDLALFVLEHVSASEISEDCVLAVTSKLVSLSERSVVPRTVNKGELIRSQADVYLGEIGYGSHLTLKHGLLVASAGIDESNSAQGDFILYPSDPFASASRLRHVLMRAWGLKNLGIILTDSRTAPLRWGVNGVALAVAGFEPLQDCRGEKDLFGRPLQMTRIHRADSLASVAVMLMGEGSESMPLAVIRASGVKFTERSLRLEDLAPSWDEDMYAPVLKAFKKSQET